MAAGTYDVIVIGAGPTGENVAARAVRGGLHTVIVESELVGGECSYWACMPSKALLRPPQALAEARAVDGARQAAHGTLDAAAGLAGERRVVVTPGAAGATPVELTARHAVVVATGTRAALPPIPGLAEAKPW